MPKAQQLIPGQFFDYVGMLCICDGNSGNGQPIRFCHWKDGEYRMNYCGPQCEVTLLPYKTWEETRHTQEPCPSCNGKGFIDRDISVETDGGSVDMAAECECIHCDGSGVES